MEVGNIEILKKDSSIKIELSYSGEFIYELVDLTEAREIAAELIRLADEIEELTKC